MNAKVKPRLLILIRHAHRDIPMDRTADNGLSEKGLDQALNIEAYYRKQFHGDKPEIFSSRLKRCVQTVTPLAKAYRLKVEISPLLIEHWMDKSDETDKEFKTRIETFFENWKKGTAPITIACSHGDWIPEALNMYFALQADVKKGSWTEIEWNGQDLKLKAILQSV